MTKPMIDLNEAVLATKAFSTNSLFGYDPRQRMLEGTKRQTLRKIAWKPGLYECTIDGKRSGIVIRVTHSERIDRADFLTDEFAKADGFNYTNDGVPPRGNLAHTLSNFGGGHIAEQMTVNYFEVTWVKQDGEWQRWAENAY